MVANQTRWASDPEVTLISQYPRPSRRGSWPRRWTWWCTCGLNAIDRTGFAGDSALATSLEVAAADNLKRARRAPGWTVDPGTAAMTALLEVKTVWHSIGV